MPSTEFVPVFFVLYLYPIKQGLKLKYNILERLSNLVLYLYPIKQGLKLIFPLFVLQLLSVLYLYPIKQGLKRNGLRICISR